MGVLAIDFGGTRTRAAWFDETLQQTARHESLSRVDEPQMQVLERLIDTARQVVPTGQRPQAIGIAAPGPLDPVSGTIRHAHTLPGWREVALAKMVSDAFGGVMTLMQNDANLAALAEYHLGAGRGCDPVLYLTISTGIGGGAVLGGQLFSGWHGLAPEPGHQQFYLPDGRLLRLEEIASGTGLGMRARERLASEGHASILRELTSIDGKSVGEAARAGDAFALEIVREAGHYLGLGLVNLVHLFNPQAIILGGSVSQLGEMLIGPAREVILSRILDSGFYDESMIRPAQLGDDVCLTGAAYYAAGRLPV